MENEERRLSIIPVFSAPADSKIIVPILIQITERGGASKVYILINDVRVGGIVSVRHSQ